MKEEEAEQLNSPTEEPKRFRPTSPPPITRRIRRPWKGIFLVMFLFFAGCLFLNFSIDHYDKYDVCELMILWFLSLLLFIPSVYFGVMIVLVELGAGGLTYQSLP